MHSCIQSLTPYALLASGCVYTVRLIGVVRWGKAEVDALQDEEEERRFISPKLCGCIRHSSRRQRDLLRARARQLMKESSSSAFPTSHSTKDVSIHAAEGGAPERASARRMYAPAATITTKARARTRRRGLPIWRPPPFASSSSGLGGGALLPRSAPAGRRRASFSPP